MSIEFDTPTLVHAVKMEETLNALREKFAINFFHFARRFKDNQTFSISTNKEWHLKYKKNYECVDTFMDKEKIKKYKNIYVWETGGFNTKKEQEMHDERTKSFAIPPGISLMNETDSYVDTYSFSTSMMFQNRINNLLNESNNLYKFGLDFAKDISLIISDDKKKNLLTSNNNQTIKPIIPSNIANINNDLKSIRHLNISNQTSKLEIFTLRQIECIYCSAQGLNSQQTGFVLDISKRTVESCLNNAMLKLNCINKYQLIYQSTKYGLISDDLISNEIKNSIEDITLNLM